MHIAILTPTYFPIRGGSEQTINEWAVRLSQKDKVTIVTVNWKKSPYFEKLSSNLQVYRIPPFDIRFIGQFIRAFLIFIVLLKIHIKNKIDIIHMGHVFFIGRGVLFFKKIMKVPLITTLLGWDTYDPVTPLPKRSFPYLSRVMNGSDKVITMSNHMIEAAKKIGCTKEISIIPHGSSFSKDVPKKNINIREKYKISSSTKIVFSLQRLEPRKGMQYLIKAIPGILDNCPNTVFIIGGIGKEKIILEKMVKELSVDKHVIFAGFISDDELFSYYEQSTIFVLPTLYEAFGLVYVDALTCGLPIVTTKVGGALDIVTEDAGILVDTKDSEGLKNAVVLALNKEWDNNHIKSMALKYDWDNIINQYKNIYNSVVNIKSSKTGR